MALFPTTLKSSLSSASGASLTDEDFKHLRDFIYTACGIYISDSRKYLIENRLSGRLRALNLKDFNEYNTYLRYDPRRNDEMKNLYNVITTNETSFYRNPPQLDVLQKIVLPDELAKIRKSGVKKLRIWSAGCSTGEEPYTISIILHEVLKSEINSWDIKITANDLSSAVLASAEKAEYNDYTLRTTPPGVVRQYFKKDGSKFTVVDSVKKLVHFAPINLNDRVALKRNERSHIILCRNVIIYFDEEMKKQVMSSFYDNLLPNGCMLIGHSESLHNISRAFTPEHHTGTIVYRKKE